MGKILIVYDSGYGATANAAEAISTTLTNKGFDVDLRITDLEDTVGYDAAIIGSPIRLGHCTPKIKRFLKKNKSALSFMQVAFFFTCMSVTTSHLKKVFWPHIFVGGEI